MIKIDDKTKVGDIPHGTKVTCEIIARPCEAVFVIDNNLAYLLQDVGEGVIPQKIRPKDYDKKYSWSLGNAASRLLSRCASVSVRDFKIISEPTAKPTKKKVTYQKQFVDSNGMHYTEDAMGTWTIADLEAKIIELRADVNRKSARLRTHKRLFKKG